MCRCLYKISNQIKLWSNRGTTNCQFTVIFNKRLLAEAKHCVSHLIHCSFSASFSSLDFLFSAFSRPLLFPGLVCQVRYCGATTTSAWFIRCPEGWPGWPCVDIVGVKSSTQPFSLSIFMSHLLLGKHRPRGHNTHFKLWTNLPCKWSEVYKK